MKCRQNSDYASDCPHCFRSDKCEGGIEESPTPSAGFTGSTADTIAALRAELEWYGHRISGGGPVGGYAKAGRAAEARWYSKTSPLLKSLP